MLTFCIKAIHHSLLQIQLHEGKEGFSHKDSIYDLEFSPIIMCSIEYRI